MNQEELIFRPSTKEDFDYCLQYGINHANSDMPDGNIVFTSTLEYQGNILVMGGIVKITKTTAWGWVELTPDAMNYSYTVYKKIKSWREEVCRDNGVLRFQAWIAVENEVAIRFNKHLGLHEESVLKNFLGQGKDAYLYVKFMGVK